MMEVFRSLPEGTRAELIDNQLYMSPSPIYAHQKTIQSIFRALCAEVSDKRRGEVIISPFDVYLDERSNAVQPDLIVVLNENSGIIDPGGHIHGVPDILVEVLSPNNREHDLVVKKNLYERFGVKEYWIVDPEDKSTFVYQLNEKSYELRIRDIGRINSDLLAFSFQF